MPSGAVKSDAGRQTHLELHRDANVSAWSDGSWAAATYYFAERGLRTFFGLAPSA